MWALEDQQASLMDQEVIYQEMSNARAGWSPRGPGRLSRVPVLSQSQPSFWCDFRCDSVGTSPCRRGLGPKPWSPGTQSGREARWLPSQEAAFYMVLPTAHHIRSPRPHEL